MYPFNNKILLKYPSSFKEKVIIWHIGEVPSRQMEKAVVRRATFSSCNLPKPFTAKPVTNVSTWAKTLTWHPRYQSLQLHQRPCPRTLLLQGWESPRPDYQGEKKVQSYVNIKGYWSSLSVTNNVTKSKRM